MMRNGRGLTSHFKGTQKMRFKQVKRSYARTLRGPDSVISCDRSSRLLTASSDSIAACRGTTSDLKKPSFGGGCIGKRDVGAGTVAAWGPPVARVRVQPRRL